MTHKLRAQSETGQRLVALAEAHASDFAGRAARHDRDGTFPFENLAELQASGYLYAPVPEVYGGMGVDSAHDVLVASSRLAEGDASLTLGVNMHFVTLLSMARMYAIAGTREDAKRAAAIGAQMEEFVRSRAVIASAVSEPRQNLLRPRTVATYGRNGWVVNGRKIITSMAPAATHFAVALAYVDDKNEERYAYAIIPRETPGLTIHDDWDALGMRASGSVSVSLDNCPIPNGPGRGALAGIITAEYLEQTLISGLAHAAASLGVAEAAFQEMGDAVARERGLHGSGDVRATARHLAAENAIDLSAARAILGRALTAVVDHYSTHPTGYGSLDAANAIFAEAQAAKSFVTAAAVRIVDRAMTIVGGAAFMHTHPLARHYRDARAGGFMQPLGANLAFEYIGAVALGLNPETL